MLLFPCSLHISTRHVVFFGFDRAHCLKKRCGRAPSKLLYFNLFSVFASATLVSWFHCNLHISTCHVIFWQSCSLLVEFWLWQLILVLQACKEVLSCLLCLTVSECKLLYFNRFHISPPAPRVCWSAATCTLQPPRNILAITTKLFALLGVCDFEI